MKRIAFALVAFMVLGGCRVMVGDSIATRIPTDGFSAVDGSGSRTATSPGRRPGAQIGITAVKNISAGLHAGDWVVIELGSNDVTNDPFTYPSRISLLVGAVPPGVCIAMPTVYRPAYGARVERWNSTMRFIIALRHNADGCSRVVEWQAAVLRDHRLIASDELHPSHPFGEQVYHDMLIGATS